MKIAIAAQGTDKTSKVSERGGRAPYYLIFEDGELIEAFKNPFATGGGGAGFAVPKALAQKGVEKVIGKQFGGNMLRAMEETGIVMAETTEQTVEEALKD
ncbi:hypothetical protein GF367_03390 [Candidatus Woesearchaeota archaeon]|nr:hypothetical protein [Candidatus Woesearchaeota archaeon]